MTEQRAAKSIENGDVKEQEYLIVMCIIAQLYYLPFVVKAYQIETLRKHFI